MTLDEPVSDSTDWLHTPLSALAPLESSLRCQVCKDFFNTPMITTCSHTFCSLCIRRYLSQEGRCPACRQNDAESKLRRNWVVEELVTSFKDSRNGLLDIARQAIQNGKDTDTYRPNKRRKIEADLSTRQVPTRSTRSQARNQAVQASHESLYTNKEVADSDSEYEDELQRSTYQQDAVPKPTFEPDDGLTACPSCQRRMKVDAVFSHLDTCESSFAETVSPQFVSKSTSRVHIQPSAINQQERLPTLAYSMLNDNALRKKLRELGISNQGPKLLMQKRHTEWVNLWNANCDSTIPRSKRDLLKELEMWERTQGRQIVNNLGPSGVMAKDFDGNAYIKNNKNDFDDLIRRAREKAKANQAETDGVITACGSNDVDTDAEVEATANVPAETVDPAFDVVQESSVHKSNGYINPIPPPKPAMQEPQHQSSQPQNIAI